MGLTTNRYRAVMGRATGSWLDLFLICGMLLLAFASIGFTDGLKLVDDVEFQPLASATRRLIEALDYLGFPPFRGCPVGNQGGVGFRRPHTGGCRHTKDS